MEDDTETFAALINPGDFNLSDLGIQDLPPPPPEMLKPVSPCAKYLSQESLPPKEEQNHASGLSADCLPPSSDCLPPSADCLPPVKQVTKNGFDTMPRAAGKNSQFPSFMRRSSSVPCKTSAQNNRGSTSSSDSGFSPGSPNNASCMTTTAK